MEFLNYLTGNCRSCCELCGGDMLTVRGCAHNTLQYGAKTFIRIAVGRGYEPLDFEGRCVECGAVRGWSHHLGCCQEKCPVCGALLYRCGCSPAEIEELYWNECDF